MIDELGWSSSAVSLSGAIRYYVKVKYLDVDGQEGERGGWRLSEECSFFFVRCSLTHTLESISREHHSQHDA